MMSITNELPTIAKKIISLPGFLMQVAVIELSYLSEFSESKIQPMSPVTSVSSCISKIQIMHLNLESEKLCRAMTEVM